MLLPSIIDMHFRHSKACRDGMAFAQWRKKVVTQDIVPWRSATISRSWSSMPSSSSASSPTHPKFPFWASCGPKINHCWKLLCQSRNHLAYLWRCMSRLVPCLVSNLGLLISSRRNAVFALSAAAHAIIRCLFHAVAIPVWFIPSSAWFAT